MTQSTRTMLVFKTDQEREGEAYLSINPANLKNEEEAESKIEEILNAGYRFSASEFFKKVAANLIHKAHQIAADWNIEGETIASIDKAMLDICYPSEIEHEINRLKEMGGEAKECAEQILKSHIALTIGLRQRSRH